MAKTFAFIDGFNIYHALTESDKNNLRPYACYRWLNYRKLVECFLREKDELSSVFYFTAYAAWESTSGDEKRKRHHDFVDIQRDMGVNVVLGRFRPTWKKCMAQCKQRYQTFEEKRTDVNIAVTMIKLAMLNQYEKAILFSGDSDIIPAIEAIKETRPQIRITVVAPLGRKAQAISNAAHSVLHMKERHLKESLLPHQVTLKNGIVISCPQGWMKIC